MSNTYKPVSPWAKARHDEDVVELDLSAADEADLLRNGHLEIVPRKYKVTSAKYADHQVGDEVEGALQVEAEQMLLSGGHLERVEEKKPAKKSAAKHKVSDD